MAVQRILLSHSYSTDPRDGDKMLITGFGRTGPNEPGSPLLNGVNVTTLDVKECAKMWNVDPFSPCHKKVICNFDYDPFKGNFKGDSGGPLVFNGKQVAIVSFGNRKKRLPQVQTRISSYIAWIRATTGLNL